MPANCTADEETCAVALQPEGAADSQTKTGKYVHRLSRAEPIVKIAAAVVLALLISLPLIFLLGAVFALTGIMSVDGSIKLDDDENRPFVKALASIWLAIWLSADMLARVLLLCIVVGAFVAYLC